MALTERLRQSFVGKTLPARVVGPLTDRRSGALVGARVTIPIPGTRIEARYEARFADLSGFPEDLEGIRALRDRDVAVELVGADSARARVTLRLAEGA
jgi:hypothetical protein